MFRRQAGVRGIGVHERCPCDSSLPRERCCGADASVRKIDADQRCPGPLAYPDTGPAQPAREIDERRVRSDIQSLSDAFEYFSRVISLNLPHGSHIRQRVI